MKIFNSCAYLLTVFLHVSLYLNAAFDLEDNIQDFVLETKKISIPGFPHAYNPSIIRHQEKWLLSFRYTPSRKARFESYIGLIWLDDEFNPLGTPQILDTVLGSPVYSRAADARLVSIGDKLFLVYEDNRDLKISKGGFRVYIAEILCSKKSFCLQNIECFKTFEGESREKREKNWVPFDYQGEFLLAYSLDPHLIFRPILGMGTCETLISSKQPLEWQWGELRGGTPALRLEDKYLAFFHSSLTMKSLQSDGEEIQHYFIGAYTFMCEPPFALLQMSSKPIIAKGFYSGERYEYYWKPVRAVFPCGYVYDNDYIWIAYGRHDHEAWIVKLDKWGLLKSLKPIAY